MNLEYKCTKKLKKIALTSAVSILSVQKNMVNVNYKGNMNLKIKMLRRNI